MEKDLNRKSETEISPDKSTGEKPQAPEAKIPDVNQKMDIPVPKRSGIIIGPEGPYRDTYVPSPDSDAR